MRFVDVVVRQAHPGPREPAYETFAQKLDDARQYRDHEGIAWDVAVDDLFGSVHRAYGGLADPTYLLDADGRVAFYDLWTHAPTLHRAIEALLAQGGRGVVRGGRDRTMHLLAALTEGWRALRPGLPQSALELMLVPPAGALGLWLGHRLRPLLAPLALRARPLPLGARVALGAGALAAAALGVGLALAPRRARRRRWL